MLLTKTAFHKEGFTLIELLLVAAIIAILAALSYPGYREYIKRTETAIAIADIRQIEMLIDRYYFDFNKLPDNLNGIGPVADPWGNPYQFVNFDNINGNGKKRKDKNLVPINSDYDLYSKGPDGASVTPLTAKKSKDDIIRANNGGFIGKAENY